MLEPLCNFPRVILWRRQLVISGESNRHLNKKSVHLLLGQTTYKVTGTCQFRLRPSSKLGWNWTILNGTPCRGSGVYVGLSLRRPGLNSSPTNVVFVVNKVSLAQGLLWVPQFNAVSTIHYSIIDATWNLAKRFGCDLLTAQPAPQPYTTKAGNCEQRIRSDRQGTSPSRFSLQFLQCHFALRQQLLILTQFKSNRWGLNRALLCYTAARDHRTQYSQ